MRINHINMVAFLIALFAVIIFVLSFGFNNTNIIQEKTTVQEFNGWKVNGVATDLNEAPIKCDDEVATVYTNTITRDMVGKSVEFRTSHQRARVYIDYDMVYSIENGSFFNPSAGTSYNIVQIPTDAAGKEIRVEIYNSFEGFENTDKVTFMYGRVDAIYRYFYFTEFWDNLINMLLLISGLSVLVGSLTLIRYVKSMREIIYLSLFELFIALWSLTSSALFNIFVGYPSAMNTLSYYSIFLAPLFCMLYVRNSTYGKNVSKNFITLVLAIHCTYIIVATILQMAHVTVFKRILWMYHLILGVEIVVFGIYFLKNLKIEKGKGEGSRIDKFLILLLVGVALDILSWHVTFSNHTRMTRIGLLIYTTSIMTKFARKVFGEINELISRDELKEIAYKDQLTGLRNRNAFISKINYIDLDKVMIVAFDLNNLKYYNDRFGHDKGDLLLHSMADTLSEVFGDDAYRIGGDEFEVVIEDCTIDELWEKLEKFENAEKTFNEEKHGVFLQAAYGVGYKQGGDTINDIMKMADENMYMHKQFLKSKGIGILK